MIALRFQSISMSHPRRSDGVEDTCCFAYQRSHSIGEGLSLVSRWLVCIFVGLVVGFPLVRIGGFLSEGRGLLGSR